MRVGYLTYGLDRSPTGIGRYAVELLHALSALPGGPEMVLLTTEREDKFGLWGHFEHHALPGCHLLPALMTIGNPLLSLAGRRYNLDIVHDPNGIAPFLGMKDGVQWITTIHDAFAYVSPGTHNHLDNWRYRWMLPVAARRANAVITVSQTSRRDLIHHLNLASNQVMVTAEGVNSIFRPTADTEERRRRLAHYGIERPYILYLGGLNPRKNITRLLKAFSQVHARHPQTALVIGGKRQWQMAEIDTALNQPDLARQVLFTGYVLEADLPALYSAAEVFVFPSLYEGFGLPPLEAMACGTPVVTSNIGSLLEVAGDAALTVNPYDVDELAQAIERGLTDQGLRADLQKRGILHAAKYQWNRTAQETFLIYRHVLRQAVEKSNSTFQESNRNYGD